ncbi:Transposase family Tnp2 protein [Ceratobasidium sp. AG-Ba]|nr:Transposase family Tnp2 protein [Ceratobasidium sp. AG-Ba]
MGYKLDCPDCGQSLSPKTVRRHSRMGCPGSKRRKNKLIRSAERTVRLGYAPHPTAQHKGNKRPCPVSPSPSPDPPGTPTQPRKRQKNNLRAQHKSWPRSPSPSSGEDTRLCHPDFRLDSPGAGPSSQFPSSLLCSPIDTGDPLTTLYKEQPWLKGLSAEDIVRMRTQEEIAREGGFKLSPEDLLVAEALNYKVTIDATGYAYEAIPHAFPGRLNGFPDESEYTLLVAQLTGMKGITGIRAAGSNKNYVPLSRPYAAHDEGPRSYNPLNLPQRTHVEFLREALHVKKSKTNAQEERRSQRTGINGLSSLVQLGSLDFPGSFPHDFMHVMFENLIPTLISLWTCSDKYSTFGSEDDNYILDKTVWSALCNACAQTGNTIPARFGCRVPNFATNRGEATSESTLLFATLLAPALLRRQFSDSATITTLLNSSHLLGSVARS